MNQEEIKSELTCISDSLCSVIGKEMEEQTSRRADREAVRLYMRKYDCLDY